MALHNLPAVFKECLSKHCDQSQLSDDCTEFGSVDDANENAYRENLVKKATNCESDDGISSTQDESDVSSFVWKRPSDQHQCKILEQTLTSSSQTTPPGVVECSMPTIPFVSLDLRWVDFEATERAQVSDPNVTTEVCAPVDPCSVSSLGQIERTISAIIPQKQKLYRSVAVVPSQIFVSLDDVSVDSEMITLDTEILDPTEPLIHGSLDHVSGLASVADGLHELLMMHLESPHDAAIRDEVVLFIEEHPESCQIRYLPNEQSGACFPLTYVCVSGCLAIVKAAYAAFPEAIGCEDGCLGLPLHYACHHATHLDVVNFLLESYPEAARRSNGKHQTPLHLACHKSLPNVDLTELLLRYYPMAAQAPDASGYTPVHLVCSKKNADVLLPKLLDTSPMAIAAVTADMQKPLHIAAFHGASLTVVEMLLKKDISQARCTDENFQTPLHKAVTHHCHHKESQASLEVIELLITAAPGRCCFADFNDETPIDICCRLNGDANVLQLLDA